MKTLWSPPLTVKKTWSFNVSDIAAQAHKNLIKRHDPDTGNANYELLLPRSAVVATGMPLLPLESANDADIWWQLSEADQHTFRVVYFHIVIMRAARGGDPVVRAVTAWLRWAAVRQAKSERRSKSGRLPSWSQAYDVACKRLIDTVAGGGSNTMKKAYGSVQGILMKAKLG